MFLKMEITHKQANEILEETVARIAFHVKRVREEKGLTERELGECINSTYQIIQRVETGNGKNANISAPQLPTLLKISKVCNVCVTEFFKPIPQEEVIKKMRKRYNPFNKWQLKLMLFNIKK